MFNLLGRYTQWRRASRRRASLEKHTAARRIQPRRLFCESLEERSMLSGSLPLAPTSLVLLTSAPSITYGQSETLTATVSPVASGTGTPNDGTVTFVDQATSTTLGTVNVTNGTAAITIPALAAGWHTFEANYSGDSTTYLPSASAVVTDPSPIVTSPVGLPIFAGPGSMVWNFTCASDALAVSSPNDGGPADIVGTLPIATCPIIICPIATEWLNPCGGDSVYVAPAVLTVTADNASRLYGATDPTFSDSITGFVNGETLASSGMTGAASLTSNDVLSSPAGTYTITAAQGTLSAQNYTFTFDTGTLSVTPVTGTALATATLDVSAGATTYGQSETLTAAIGGGSGAATGIVSFFDGGATLGSAPVVNGAATIAVTSLPAGTDGVTAVYSGDVNYATAASSSVAIDVSPAVLTVTANNASRSYGAADPTLSDSITGFANGDTLASSGVSGTASLTGADSSSSPAGSYSITAGLGTLAAQNYTFTFVAGTLTVSPVATSISLQTSASSITQGQSETLTAVISGVGPGSGAPNSGTVTFVDQTTSTILGTATVTNGAAAITVPSLPAGTHVLEAAYSGDGLRYLPSSTGVSPSSIITTVAGNGASTYSGDGSQATATGISPQSVVLDGHGDLFIADGGYVREVNLATGAITTVADLETADSVPGVMGTLAVGPLSLAVDASGDLFVADWSYGVVREVNIATGAIATVANVPDPSALAVDNAGHLFIGEYWYGRVQEVNLSTGVITTVAGNGSLMSVTTTVASNGAWLTTVGSNGDGGQATAASIGGTCGIAVDSTGHLFIADQMNCAIREVNLSTGIITTIAGSEALEGTSGAGFSGDGGQATAATLFNPMGLALDGGGDLFIADSGNNRIREINLASGAITTVAVANGPGSLATDSAGDLFFVDNGRVREIAAGGAAVVVAPAPPTLTGSNSIAVYAASSGYGSASNGRLSITDDGAASNSAAILDQSADGLSASVMLGPGNLTLLVGQLESLPGMVQNGTGDSLGGGNASAQSSSGTTLNPQAVDQIDPSSIAADELGQISGLDDLATSANLASGV